MNALKAAPLLLALVGSHALAQEPAPAHQLTLYTRTALGLFLSDARTAGGVGGGLGVRDTLHGRFLLQADASYLLGLGNALEVRLGAGLQRQGTYTPAALLTLSGVMGDQLRFLSDAHPSPARGPALALGVQLAPLRFTHQGMQVSVLELGAGVGPEWPGTGVSLSLGLLEVGCVF
jgi:hypothetical protein